MGCITEDYKNILTGLVVSKLPYETIASVIDTIPLCEKGAPPATTEAVAGVKRKMAVPWDIEPVYVDENKKETTVSSLSALIRDLNLPMSGIQCDVEGKKCRALSAVDILRIHGYTVSGNGEPRKKSEGGKKLTVYHPDAVPKEKKGKGA